MIAAGGGIEIPAQRRLHRRRSGHHRQQRHHREPGRSYGDRVDGMPPCPGLFDGYCPFAAAYGAGIDSWGSLTVINSTVSGNWAGSASGVVDLGQ